MKTFFRLPAGAAPVLILAALTLAGCAALTANVVLRPTPESEDLGRGAPVYVTAVDARTHKVVCKRPKGMLVTGEVTVSETLTAELARAASAVLAAKGFAPGAADAETVRKVTVELRELTCQSVMRPAETKADAQAKIEIVVDNNGHPAQKSFEGQTSWSLKGADLEPDYDKLFSLTLTKALNHMAQDYDLLNDLAAVKLRTKDLK